MTNAVNLAALGSTGVSPSFKNRIINGAMVIDQRNAGASVTPTSDFGYSLDRWMDRASVASKYTVQQNSGSVTPPAGFTNYLGVVSTSAYSVGSTDFLAIEQRIEGYNIADLDFGKSTAKTVTLSFWVRSSLTGTFGGSLRNNALDYTYVFSYTISAANTWEQKSITITGATAGTWLTTFGIGCILSLNLGVGSTFTGASGTWSTSAIYNPTGATSVVGTNGATFYITGVQLEVGSSATGFEYRQYQQELALCQRYLPATDAGDVYSGYSYAGIALYIPIPFKVSTRVAPTGITVSSFGAAWNGVANYYSATGATYVSAGVNSALLNIAVPNNFTAGQGAAYQAPKILFNGCEL